MQKFSCNLKWVISEFTYKAYSRLDNTEYDWVGNSLVYSLNGHTMIKAKGALMFSEKVYFGYTVPQLVFQCSLHDSRQLYMHVNTCLLLDKMDLEEITKNVNVYARDLPRDLIRLIVSYIIDFYVTTTEALKKVLTFKEARGLIEFYC